MMPLHEKLRIMRYEKRFTQEDVAKHLGISVSTLRAYETRPTRVPASTVMALFRLYECTLFDDFGVYMDVIDMDIPIIEFCKFRAESEVKKEREMHIKLSGNPMPDVYYTKRYEELVEKMNKQYEN